VTEHVELSVPARSDFLSLARLHVGGVATRMDVTVEELELLQLAVEELCLSLVRPHASAESRLQLVIEWSDEVVEVHCHLSHPRTSPGHAEGGETEPLAEELSRRLLDAIVDEHGASFDDEQWSTWLRTRWGRETP
jgi:hypothetical protein